MSEEFSFECIHHGKSAMICGICLGRREEELRNNLELAIKAKLEAVECGITTFEEEFLAHIVVPGQHGMTMGDLMLKRLESAYETNKTPALSWDGK